MPAPPMPAVFFGHGSPMNAIERNRYTEAWRAFGASVPRPRAILIRHAFPHADIPVVQLAINAMKPMEYHLDLGARLAPLRERGVLIAASGNVVHNLGRIDMSMSERSFDWAERFGETAGTLLVEGPDDPAPLPDPAVVPTDDTNM